MPEIGSFNFQRSTENPWTAPFTTTKNKVIKINENFLHDKELSKIEVAVDVTQEEKKIWMRELRKARVKEQWWALYRYTLECQQKYIANGFHFQIPPSRYICRIDHQARKSQYQSTPILLRLFIFEIVDHFAISTFDRMTLSKPVERSIRRSNCD